MLLSGDGIDVADLRTFRRTDVRTRSVVLLVGDTIAPTDETARTPPRALSALLPVRDSHLLPQLGIQVDLLAFNRSGRTTVRSFARSRFSGIDAAEQHCADERRGCGYGGDMSAHVRLLHFIFPKIIFLSPYILYDELSIKK